MVKTCQVFSGYVNCKVKSAKSTLTKLTICAFPIMHLGYQLCKLTICTDGYIVEILAPPIKMPYGIWAKGLLLWNHWRTLTRYQSGHWGSLRFGSLNSHKILQRLSPKHNVVLHNCPTLSIARERLICLNNDCGVQLQTLILHAVGPGFEPQPPRACCTCFFHHSLPSSGRYHTFPASSVKCYGQPIQWFDNRNTYYVSYTQNE